MNTPQGKAQSEQPAVETTSDCTAQTEIPQADAITTTVDSTATRVDTIRTPEEVIKELFANIRDTLSIETEIKKINATESQFYKIKSLADQITITPETYYYNRTRGPNISDQRWKELDILEQLDKLAGTRDFKALEKAIKEARAYDYAKARKTIIGFENRKKELSCELKRLTRELLNFLKTQTLDLSARTDVDEMIEFLTNILTELRELSSTSSSEEIASISGSIENMANTANTLKSITITESDKIASLSEEIRKLHTKMVRISKAATKPIRIHTNQQEGKDVLNINILHCNVPQNDWVMILPSNDSTLHIGWGHNSQHYYRGGNSQIYRLANAIKQEGGICEITNDDHYHGVNGTITMGGSIKTENIRNKNHEITGAKITFTRTNYDCWDTPLYARQIIEKNTDRIKEALRAELKVENVILELDF